MPTVKEIAAAGTSASSRSTRVAARAKRAERDLNTGEAAWIAWRRAEGIPGIAIGRPTHKDRACLIKIMRAFPGRPERFSGFLEWVVGDWRGIMARQFHWMTKVPPPDLPSVGFLSRFCERFFADWRTVHDARKVGTSDAWRDEPWAGEVSYLLALGRPLEDALREVRGRHGLD